MRKDQFINKHQHLNISQAELDRKWRVLQEEEEMQRLWEAAERSQRQQTESSAPGVSPGGTPPGGAFYVLGTDGNIYFWNNLTSPAIPVPDPIPNGTQCCDAGDGSFYFLIGGGGWFLGKMDKTGTYVEYENNIGDFAQGNFAMTLYREPDGSLIMVDDKLKKGGYQHIIRISIDEEALIAAATLVAEVEIVDGLGRIYALFPYNGEIWAMVNGVDNLLVAPYDITDPGFTIPPVPLVLYSDNTEVQLDTSIGNVLQASDGNVYLNAVFEDLNSDTTSGYFIVNMEPVPEVGTQANFVRYSYFNNNDLYNIALSMFNITTN
jgi:hypothetical protein